VTRTAPRTTTIRVLAGVATATLLLSGCTGGTTAEVAGSEASAPSQAESPAQTPEPLPLLEGPIASTTESGQASPEYEQRVLATGLDEGTAFLLSQTRSTVDVVDGHTFVVHHEYPNGATGEATYHLFAPTAMSPSDPPVFAGEADGDEYRYTMTYAVDTTAMPADMLAQIENGLPTASPAAAGSTGVIQLLGVAPTTSIVRADDGGAHTVGVLVDGLISQGKESSIDTFVEAGKKHGLTKTAGSWDAYKSGAKVWDALEANDAIATLMAELDALEACATNPTATLTQQEYAKNPASQQKALQAITQARFEIRVSIGVLFTTMIADTGSALVAEAPWLGFLVSPAVNYTKDAQMEAIRSYVENAKANVVPCVPKAYTISGTIPSIPTGIFVTGKTCTLEKEFTAFTDGDYVGRLVFSPGDASSGTTRFKGKVGNAPISVRGHGDYTVTLADDGASGAIDFPFTSTIELSKIPSPRPVPDQTGTKPAHLTLTETAACKKLN
jgi:hypothetical protein